jgi:hypothetical protein
LKVMLELERERMWSISKFEKTSQFSESLRARANKWTFGRDVVVFVKP